LFIMFNILICVDNEGYIAPPHDCRRVLVIDIDEQRVVDRVEVEPGQLPGLIEFLDEKYDLQALLTCEPIGDSTVLYDTGVYVHVVRDRKHFNNILDEIYGFTVDKI